MRGIFRVFLKDLLELLGSARGLVLVVVLPSLILLLVGGLRSKTVPYQILVAGSLENASRESQRTFEEFVEILQELELVELSTRPEPLVDPFDELSTNFDLVVNVEGAQPDTWLIYVAEQQALRLQEAERLAADLDRVLRVIQSRIENSDEKGGEAPDVANEFEQFVAEFGALGRLPPQRLVTYFSRAADVRFDLVTRTMALILCFLSFVLSVPSLIRERESHTLELLLVAPGSGPTSVIFGKCLFAVTITVFDLALMLILADSVYAIHIKPGLLQTLLALLPAFLSTALLGLAVSVVVTSQTQAMATAAGYFLGMTLFSGLLYPLEQASKLVSWLSYLFPLTFVKPVLVAWLLGVPPASSIQDATWILWAQCLVVMGIAIPCSLRALHRI